MLALSPQQWLIKTAQISKRIRFKNGRRQTKRRWLATCILSQSISFGKKSKRARRPQFKKRTHLKSCQTARADSAETCPASTANRVRSFTEDLFRFLPAYKLNAHVYRRNKCVVNINIKHNFTIWRFKLVRNWILARWCTKGSVALG